MKKKLLLAVCAVTCATAMAVGFTACGDGDNSGMSADDAAKKIATFTTSPTTVNATFKQTYKLDVNSANASFKAFEQDIADTVTIQADYTAGNVYYYGKKVAKDNSVLEQLVVKEDSTYYYLTSKTVKKALADEAAAKAKINELMTSLTKQTTGYVDGDAFVYNADWVHTYLLLGVNTVNGTESKYFDYKYDNAENDGLKIDLDMKYVGYYGDRGAMDFGTDETHTGSTANIVTDGSGFITSFNQTFNNHLEMPVSNPPVPLDLTGTRSLTATYNGTLTKKAATDIAQTLNNPTVTFANPDNATVAVFDMVISGGKPTSTTPVTSGGSVDIGHWIAVKVTPETDYEVDKVTVGGHDTMTMAGFYCYQVTEDDYNLALKIDAKIKSTDTNAPKTGTIVVTSVEHANITTYDYVVNDNSTLTTPSNTVTVGNFIAIKIVCDSGYEIETVKVNGTTISEPMFGYYCFRAATATTYTVVVTLRAAS